MDLPPTTTLAQAEFDGVSVCVLRDVADLTGQFETWGLEFDRTFGSRIWPGGPAVFRLVVRDLTLRLINGVQRDKALCPHTLEEEKENPSNRVNSYFAGHQLLLNGKFEAALPYLYSALDWKPLQSQALQALALAQARLGN